MQAIRERRTERHGLHIYNPTDELEALATEYKSLQRQQDSIKARLDELKAAMIDTMNGAEEAVAGVYKISNKAVTSVRLDTAAFKSVHPDIFKLFSKESTSTRFEVR
jgi:predicted phage-related endonuclease